MYEMYEAKLVSQSVSRVSMHLNHVTIMVNEKDL